MLVQTASVDAELAIVESEILFLTIFWHKQAFGYGAWTNPYSLKYFYAFYGPVTGVTGVSAVYSL